MAEQVLQSWLFLQARQQEQLGGADLKGLCLSGQQPGKHDAWLRLCCKARAMIDWSPVAVSGEPQ